MTQTSRPRSRIQGLYRALVAKDPMERFRLLRLLANWLVPNYRLKWPDMNWWDDPFFNAFLQRFNELNGLNTDRRWMLYQLARLTAYVPGDTAECGAYEGAGSFLICSASHAASPNRTHRVFDSFAGLSEPSAADGSYWSPGDLTTSREKLEQNLADFADMLAVYPGWIPESFDDIPAEADSTAEQLYAFVHIDVDLYDPTLASLEYFYPRLSPGGIILCDDYGLGFCPGATKAFDEFVADKPEQIVSLSGGSGYMVKGNRALAPLPLPLAAT